MALPCEQHFWYSSRMRRKLTFLLQMVILVAVAKGQVPVHFRAKIHARESFIHPIGHGLFFVVEQSDAGDWNFLVKPSRPTKPSLDVRESYTACLESPFKHGPRTQDLVAWRFAQDADPVWAEPIPARKNVSFTTNAANQRYECAESDALYNTFQSAQSAGRDADYSGSLPHYKSRPVGHARVVISSVALKPDPSGQNAEFESVTLQVTVTFPKEGATRHHKH